MCGEDARGCCEPQLPRTVGTPGGSAAATFAGRIDPSQFVLDNVPAAPWAYGWLGEQIVGRALEALPPGWYITHDVLLGRGGNLDHVVVGPPGVFVLNSKYHGEKHVTVIGDVVRVGPRRDSHVPQGRREAALVAGALSGPPGRELPVGSMIVVG